MKEEIPLAPYIYEGLDPAPQSKPAVTQAVELLEDAMDRFGAAVDVARKPGMPLSILANIAREAPLGSLLAAFVLGIIVTRRRVR